MTLASTDTWRKLTIYKKNSKNKIIVYWELSALSIELTEEVQSSSLVLS